MHGPLLRSSLVLPAVALAAVVVTSAFAAATLSPSGYRAQANAICARYDRAGAPKVVSGGVTRTLLVALMTSALERLRTKASAVARLHPPASLAAGHRRVVGAIDKEVAFDVQLLAEVEHAANPQAPLLAALKPGLELFGAESRAWAAVGAKGCATARASASFGF